MFIEKSLLKLNVKVFIVLFARRTARKYGKETSNAAMIYFSLYNNQINARALIGQSAVGYCAGKPTEKSRVFSIII